MKRDLAQLTGRTFDVLVIGGGIYGLTIAYDAAQRGLSVALVERDDFGSGTSFNHLRTIHGGLRYLQTLDLARARESVRERRALAIIGPDFVRAQRFVLPLFSSLSRGPVAMRLGFALDRLVSSTRNAGVLDSHRLPAGRVMGRKDARRIFPDLAPAGLAGAAVWYDYTTTEADRLTLSFALAAAKHGAVLANYVEATAPLVDGRRVTGVRVVDRLAGGEQELSARVTVNATGAAVNRLIGALGRTPPSPPIPMLQAMNLITRRRAGDDALGGRTASGRNLFLVPWRERALFGTWEADRTCAPDAVSISESDIAAFLAAVNHAFPSMNLTLADVAMVQRGVVPALVSGDRVTPDGHERVIDHERDPQGGIEGLVSVAGTKYTTARGVAERVTDGLLQKLKMPPVSCRTGTTPLPREGVRAPGPVADAEFVRAVTDEMAQTLSDVTIRRTPFGVLGNPGDAALEHAATIVAAVTGWSDERRRAEIDATKRFYRERSG